MRPADNPTRPSGIRGGGVPLLERPGKQIDLSPRDYKWLKPTAPGGYNWASPVFKRMARMTRMIKLFGPVGRALTLLGEPMDMFMSTPQQGLQPYDWAAHGWTIRHSCPAGTTCSHLPATALTGIWNCGLLSPAQFATVQANYPVTARGAEEWYGLTQGAADMCALWGGSGRWATLRQWERPVPRPAPDIPTLLEPKPRIVQPMPATLKPPEPWGEPEIVQPRDRPPNRGRPRPPYVVDGHPMVPDKPGRTKAKLRGDSLVHQIYGGLTEIGDTMDCAEKALYGRTKSGPLQERMLQLASDIYENPKQFNTLGFLKCMIYNNISDAVIGKANKWANNITKSPYWVRPVGHGAGSWAARVR